MITFFTTKNIKRVFPVISGNLGANIFYMRSKRIFTVTLFTLSLVYLVRGQVTFDTTYANSLSSDLGLQVLQTNDSGFVVIGRSLDSIGGLDLYALRVDSVGKIIWEDRYGGNRSEFDGSICKAWNGGYILLGTTFSFDAQLDDPYAVHVNDSGEVVWDSVYGGFEIDKGKSVIPFVDSTYLILGETSSYATNGLRDIFILKIDQNGDSLGYYTYGCEVRTDAKGVGSTPWGNYLIVGLGRPNNGDDTVCFFNINGDGNLNWSQSFPYPTQFAPTSLLTWDVRQSSRQTMLVKGRNFVMEIDSLGNVIHMDTTMFGQKIISLATGEMVMIGRGLGKYDQNFTNLWRRDDYGEDLLDGVELGDGGFMLLTRGFDNNGWSDIRLIRTDCEGNVQNPVFCSVTSVEPDNDFVFSLYPNPANEYLYINLPPDIHHAQLLFYDYSGRNLGDFLLHNGENRINLPEIATGLIIYEIRISDQIQYGKVLIQK
ncbi:MAG: T9SS type A sorting domain-containing protein [Bacteroidia bacterium]|nr:T9SS type A sorting domain-containing protein [Bacteroidia bacterium]